jgi:hypothetical protein
MEAGKRIPSYNQQNRQPDRSFDIPLHLIAFGGLCFAVQRYIKLDLVRQASKFPATLGSILLHCGAFGVVYSASYTALGMFRSKNDIYNTLFGSACTGAFIGLIQKPTSASVIQNAIGFAMLGTVTTVNRLRFYLFRSFNIFTSFFSVDSRASHLC